MRYALIAMLGLMLAGCGAELLTTTAIQGELQAQQLSAMQRQVKGAADSSGRIQIERAITAYQAEKGAYPPSLDALAPQYLPAVPRRADGAPYGYDPATGRLTDGAAPATGPSPQDFQTMEQIRAAINRYGTATGYYPPTLDALAPAYLPAPPRTTAGEQFIYNNQNGYLAHPRQAASAPAASPSPPALGGAGPMGEVMTGIGMQQQLGGMRQSGASAAGSHARQRLGDVGNTQNERHEQAMDALGM